MEFTDRQQCFPIFKEDNNSLLGGQKPDRIGNRVKMNGK